MKKVILKILGIKEIREHKLYFFIKLLITLMFAITIALDSVLVFQGSIFGNLSEIHFSDFQFKNILIFFGTWFLSYLIISVIQYITDKLETTIYYKKERKKKKKVYLLILLAILICWIPYILSYFPGGIFADTVSSIKQALGEQNFNNHNPILYALILRVFTTIGTNISGVQLGIELFTIFQVLVMAIILSYSVYWMYKKNVSTKYLVLITIFFGLCRLIPMYAISLWKDTPFCLALFMFTMFIAETIYQDGKNLEKLSGVFKYVVIVAFVVFLRNNGIYIATITTIILMIVYRRKIFKEFKKFTIISIIEIMICFIIQGPIYNYYKLNTEFVENLGVLLQQVCYVVTQEDGNLTSEQLEFIDGICATEIIKEIYNPCIVDKVKWDGAFNNKYLEENKTEFFKVWMKVFLKNPKSYVEAYLLNTIGFWDANKATMDAYINPQMWNNTDEVIGIKQFDYIEQITGKSVRNIIRPSKAISSAIFLFFMILMMILAIYKKKYKNLIICIPALLTWLTIMIAAPLAFSLRYVFILVLITPIAYLIPFLKQEKELNNNFNRKSIKLGEPNKKYYTKS